MRLLSLLIIWSFSAYDLEVVMSLLLSVLGSDPIRIFFSDRDSSFILLPLVVGFDWGNFWCYESNFLVKSTLAEKSFAFFFLGFR